MRCARSGSDTTAGKGETAVAHENRKKDCDFVLANGLLTSVVLALRDIPRLIAPAMNTAMYENSIVQENIAKLKAHGFEFIEPREALLACGDLGRGALAEVADIVSIVKARVPAE